MELVGLNVLEVVRVASRQVKEDNGLVKTFFSASLKTEGGEFYLPVAAGVEVPEGWSGKAFCSARVSSYVAKFRDNSNTRYCVLPVEIQSFQKIAQVQKNDALSSFGIRPAGQGGTK